MDVSLFRCPACRRRGLLDRATSFVCGDCGRAYAISHGVPILLKDYRTAPSPTTVSDEMMQTVATYVGRPRTPALDVAIGDIFGTEYRLLDLALTAENNCFFQRIAPTRSPGDAGGPPPGGTRSKSISPAYRLDAYQIPPTLPRSRLTSWNVRLTNLGREPIRGGVGGYELLVGWSGRRDAPVAGKGERTGLPVDVAPGQTLSIPLFVRTPDLAGTCTLEAALVRVGSVAGGGESWRLPIALVSDGLDGELPPGWEATGLPVETYDYGADHELAKSFVADALKGTDDPVILESGACCEPQTRGFRARVYSTDIDVQTLQIGALKHGAAFPDVRFVAADAMDLPFADAVVDCSVMFAAFHHMSDPLGCLLEMRRVTKPEGFIALLCEPVGSYRAETLDPSFKDELARGINEQIFTAWEYRNLFERAGLEVARAQVDRGSFKVILRRGGEPPPTRAPRFHAPDHERPAGIGRWRWSRSIRKFLENPLVALGGGSRKP